jgi:hypothetical protein
MSASGPKANSTDVCSYVSFQGKLPIRHVRFHGRFRTSSASVNGQRQGKWVDCAQRQEEPSFIGGKFGSVFGAGRSQGEGERAGAEREVAQRPAPFNSGSETRTRRQIRVSKLGRRRRPVYWTNSRLYSNTTIHSDTAAPNDRQRMELHDGDGLMAGSRRAVRGAAQLPRGTSLSLKPLRPLVNG